MATTMVSDEIRGEPPIERMMKPFQEFAGKEASSGILLIVATVVALVWANSPWSDSYFRFWSLPFSISLGEYGLSKSVLYWINDGLMAVFFLVIGLEVKREILVGELASVRKASLPVLAAVGGMLVPAGFYLVFNSGGSGERGWGVPMATDIAFSLGILALLGKRVGLHLKVFLTAAAIADDIGAVLVIALFYTAGISWPALAFGILFLLGLVVANRVGVRHPLVYALLGFLVWLAFLRSGVHATVAGVLVAMTIPAKARIDPQEFLVRCRTIVGDYENACELGGDVLTNRGQQAALQDLETAANQAETPLQRIEHALHPWVTFAVVPLFALANAGVDLRATGLGAVTHPISLGIVAGLVLGKQVGVLLFSFLAVRTGLANLPEGATWKQVYGVAILMGIGFTMSLFVAGLSFYDPGFLDIAKVGILIASLFSGIVGWLVLRSACPAPVEGNR